MKLIFTSMYLGTFLKENRSSSRPCHCIVILFSIEGKICGFVYMLNICQPFKCRHSLPTFYTFTHTYVIGIVTKDVKLDEILNFFTMSGLKPVFSIRGKPGVARARFITIYKMN